ncbi:hypothetical protein Agau_L101707 [Agrobacterium tumefaciens F2]|nr:hypothetical protein Agau_L101707 [Agrobacterium tumefaciens F2]
MSSSSETLEKHRPQGSARTAPQPIAGKGIPVAEDGDLRRLATLKHHYYRGSASCPLHMPATWS